MTRSDIAAAVAATRKIGTAEARAMVDDALDAVAAGVARGEVALAGFGKFSVSRRAARPGRNPRTGEPMVVGPSVRVTFCAAKALKDRIAG